LLLHLLLLVQATSLVYVTIALKGQLDLDQSLDVWNTVAGSAKRLAMLEGRDMLRQACGQQPRLHPDCIDQARSPRPSRRRRQSGLCPLRRALI